MLGEHNITYWPRTSVKGQVLADFLAEMPDKSQPDASVVETQQEPLTLFTDGSSCVDGSASNNEAEYEALIAGLRIATHMGVRNVHVKSLVSGFTNFSINQVPQSKNKKADALRKIASTSFAHLSKQVLVEILKEKSIQEKEEGGKKAMYQGPTVRIIEGGSLQAVIPYAVVKERQTFPSRPLTSNTAPWPFYKWGIDIAGPFPEGPGKVKFLIVAMDYFTKWIEAKAVMTITGSQVKKFMWDNIVCRFGLPGEIVLDNGKQFSDNPFKDWCEKLNITQRFASVKHPQSNGPVERANWSLGEGIKACLGKGNKNWVEELSMSSGPIIGMPTHRTAAVDIVHNDEEQQLNLDLLEKRRERAAIREAKAKLKMTKYYNARVRDVAFRPGDFFYRSNDASLAVDGGKLGPKWEGPYEVTEALGDEAYKLRSMDGTVLLRTWNIANLKRCYL
nr:reverse transcriptase domain-containing protein [Tanacetum cinerariifolium]